MAASGDEADEDQIEELRMDLNEGRRSDFVAKVAAVRKVLSDRGISSALISSVHNFFWLTSGGRNYVGLNTEKGVASIFIDADRVVLVTSNIEAERIATEELAGLGQIQVFAKPWFWDESAHFNRLMTLGRGHKPEADTGEVIAPYIRELRCTLSSFELEKYRILGRECGQAVADVARNVQRGMTEKQIAGAVAGECYSRGIHPVLLLVGADERMDSWRHPLPTQNEAKSRFMIVLCGRRHGLIASLTRMAHFGPLEEGSDLQKKHDAATYVDAVAMVNTKVGAHSAEIMDKMKVAYEERGFKDEWLHYNQGGAIGYKVREWTAEPGVKNHVNCPQAFAWNPSIGGTRSEDTVIVTHRDGRLPEIITETREWPMIEHCIDGIVVKRPNILFL